ncbi:MAG: methyltransferase [Magnetococcus sp. WYHC-3]
MSATPRSIRRFLDSVGATIPVVELSHMFLAQWPLDWPGPAELPAFDAFQGTLVAGRASLLESLHLHRPHWRAVAHFHPSAGEAARHVLMEPPQGREAARDAVALALASLAADGTLWLMGPNNSGLESLAEHFPGAVKVLALGHAKLYALPRPEHVSAATQERQWELAGVQLISRPGIFSWEGPDAASLMLLQSLTGPLGARVLDWGCGNGLLGLSLAHRDPQVQVVMSDDQALAVYCCQAGIQRNGWGDRCQVLLENGIGMQLADQRFSTIVSNPPFHRGIRVDHGPAERFIGRAHDLLLPGGRLWLVGSTHLALGERLRTRFANVEIVAENSRFVVYRARRS